MTKIYLVRHAEVDYIPDDYSRPLSLKGKEDVERVTEFFRDIEVDRVISSPYIRAMDTIEGIAHEKGLKIEKIHDFRERKVTDHWIDDFQRFIRMQWENFDYKLESGESLRETQERGIRALKEVRKLYKNKKIVIGTHGTLLSTLLNYFDDKYHFDFWKTLKMPDIFLLTFGMDDSIKIERMTI